jgi:hypothetical protein
MVNVVLATAQDFALGKTLDGLGGSRTRGLSRARGALWLLSYEPNYVIVCLHVCRAAQRT